MSYGSVVPVPPGIQWTKPPARWSQDDLEIEQAIKHCVEGIDAHDSPEDLVQDTAFKLADLGATSYQFVKLKNKLIHKSYLTKEDIEAWINTGAKWAGGIQPKNGHQESAIGQRPGAPLWQNDSPPAARQRREEMAPEPEIPPQWIDMSTWDKEPRPEPEYVVPGRIPLRQAVLFSGEGGGGKSTILKQLCAATVLHKYWLGVLPMKGPAFFIEAEDDERAMHTRMYDICTYYGVTFADLIAGGLQMMTRAGEDAVMAAPDKSGRIIPTKFYAHILERAGDLKPKIIAIASSANVFAGSEINRTQVMQFAGLLTRLAIAANGSTILASHPSLTGISSGTGLSGVTQWHNAFRARAYLVIPKPENGEPADPDARQLEFKKNQYGPTEETIPLRWQSGLFLPPPGMSSLSRMAQRARAEDVFLELLRRFRRENRNASDKAGTTYAPALFAKEEAAKNAGLTSKQLETAMRGLFATGRICNENYGRPSRPTWRLTIKDTAATEEGSV